jgi:hypothetical protein
MNSLFNVKSLTMVEVPSRLLWFGANGVNTFQSDWDEVIVQILDDT